MDARGELIKEIQDKCRCRCGSSVSLIYTCIDDVADFIIEDRKRIVDPLIKVKNISHGREEFDALNDAIDKTLKNAGVK